MFKKEFTVKSNICVKSSDKRKFVSLLRELYKIPDDVEILAKTDEIHLMKLTTFNDFACEVYLVNKTPWLLSLNDKYYPAVYFLWKFPDCLFAFVMHDSILPKIQTGADVMLPGIMINGELSLSALGNLDKGAQCAVRIPNNKAAVAVGYTNVSSLDMFECGMRGKGVNVVHVVGDFLWKMGPKETLPSIPLTLEPDQESTQEILKNINLQDSSDVPVRDAHSTDVAEAEPKSVLSITDSFTNFFLLALKLYMKPSSSDNAELPVLASTFHAKFLLPLINEAGENERVSVQKTEFKKFNAFLHHMQEQGVLKVEERQKGVQSIVAINLGSEMFYRLAADDKVKRIRLQPDPEDKVSKSADFKELFSITAAVLPLIRTVDSCAKKGDSISASDFRKLVTDYVKNSGLVDLVAATKTPNVLLNSLLAACVNRREGETLAWPKLFESLFAAMQPCYQFRFKDGQEGLKKGKLPSITISSAKRSGNKKILLINNVQAFGIDPNIFAKELQIQMAASASVNADFADSRCQGPQVQVQGSKTELVLKLLCDKYKVPKNSVKVV